MLCLSLPEKIFQGGLMANMLKNQELKAFARELLHAFACK